MKHPLYISKKRIYKLPVNERANFDKAFDVAEIVVELLNEQREICEECQKQVEYEQALAQKN